MVEKPVEKPRPGSIVEIIDREGQWSGYGFYNGHSRIALRVLSTDRNESINQAWFEKKIADALYLRRDLLRLDDTTDAWRVFHSEGDGISGLVIDRYADLLVVEFFSAGAFRHREWIFTALKNQFPGCRLYWFAEKHVQKQESFDCHDQPAPEPSVITENGVKLVSLS